MIVQATSGEETSHEEAPRFFTYFHYLEALRFHFPSSSALREQQVAKVAGARRFLRIARNKQANLESAASYLRNAWATEFQLALTGERSSLIPVANHWATVQVYYAVYLEIRALFVVSGRTIPNTHRAALRTVSSDLKSRPYLLPEPLNVLCEGAPPKGSCEYSNLPPNRRVDTVNTLSQPRESDRWSWLGVILRTTRERQIDELARVWKRKHGRKRLAAGGWLDLGNKLPPTSLFDFLYRLRIRSNYSNADSFLLNVGRQEAALFNENLRLVCWYCGLFVELLVSRYIGISQFAKIVGRYMDGLDSQLGRQILGSRLQLIQEHGHAP